jgi:DNA-binding transcriptional ArsR family regulator
LTAVASHAIYLDIRMHMEAHMIGDGIPPPSVPRSPGDPTSEGEGVAAATGGPVQRYAGADPEEPALLHARFFRTLGDPTRIRLLRLLTEAPTGECSVGELVAAVDAPQSRVSTHLGCLRWCGLVQARREGKQVYYRVADPRVRELLTLGSAMLHDHAAGVASCGVIR